MALCGIKTRKPGQAPGTVEYVGERADEPVMIKVIDYDQQVLEEKELQSAEDCLPYRDSKHVSWINVTGLGDVKLLKGIGDHFQLHPLVIEDIANTTQRPKVEDYGDYIYIVVRMIYQDSNGDIFAEQVSVVLVLAKADVRIATLYQDTLVEPDLRGFGDELCQNLQATHSAVLSSTGRQHLLLRSPVLARSIRVRNPYVDPINLMQIEVLRRLRADRDDVEALDLLLRTMNGLAAALRNTG
ncbi:MAG: phosphoenolpyruvate carboxylase [Candidatus Krumholzibacteria bacterium]|nr:phosphoenolpyruvate carboxylase [Candidatus Krumholzibacteria bacterium]